MITGTDRDYCLQHVQTDSKAIVMSSRMGVITHGVEWPGHKGDTYAHLGLRLGMCGTVTAFLCMSLMA